MPAAPLPPNESERIGELESYSVLDTLREPAFDDITFLASKLFDTPIALMSLVDRDRQRFKSAVGLDVTETHRDLAFCAHAIWDPTDVMVVEDAANDPRFSSNWLVTEFPYIRFYAGAPLQTATGNALGNPVRHRPGSAPVHSRRRRDVEGPRPAGHESTRSATRADGMLKPPGRHNRVERGLAIPGGYFLACS